jgi:restriction endonuclease S subunit
VTRLATFVNGSAFKPTDFSPEGEPVVRIRQLLDETAEVDLAPPPINAVWLTDGDLVFSWSATLAVRFWHRGRALLNQHLYRVDVRPEADRRWFAYVLEEGVQRLAPLMHGSAMTHITQDMLRSLTTHVPPIEEQRAIADYLDRETARIDFLIKSRNRLTRLLSQRRQSLAAQLMDRASEMGDCVPLWATLHPVERRDCADREVLSVYRDHGVIPKSSRSDNFNKTPDDLSRYLVVEPGDVVVNKMKAWQGSLGVSRFAGIVSPDYLVCRPYRLIDLEYLHHVLRSPQMRSQYVARSEGIRPSQWRLQWDQMRILPIPEPELEQQSALARDCEQALLKTERLADAAARQADVLRERRQALITAAVAGRVEVTAAA